MDTNSQYQNPNPKTDPDQYITNRLFDDSLYFEVSDYFVMDNGSEEDIFVENTIPPAENVVNESSNPSPVARNMVHRRREKKYKSQSEFKFALRTKSNIEIMDDGFKWKKYGKKMIKNSPNPRNYFKCQRDGCNVKKRVERDREDPRYVITTYEGVHYHESPNCVVCCNNQLPTHGLTLHQSSSLSFSPSPIL
ncbi:probable WRKY transcription factor 43 [Olea europaea var. sylvestris]|uniref:probable WRKY transcription factor 43 n=1 Tax=Olea europaea var. sylvestris TaxID=158386 RepID=UPI000C1CDC6B|nr:probable WRKY transcription factor 43 [Olea europaea var. sylvestris]